MPHSTLALTLNHRLIRQLRTQIKKHKKILSMQTGQILGKYIDPVIALAITILLSPLLTARYLIAIYYTGTGFEKISITGRNGTSVDLLEFNSDFPGKSMASLINIIKGDIAFVGPAINSGHNSDVLSVKPGLISIYRLRKKVRIAHEDEESANLEYLYKKSFKSDIGIVVRNAISSFLGGSKEYHTPYHIDFFNIPVWNTSMNDAVKWILMNTKGKVKKQFAFVNPDCLNITFKNEAYKKLLQQIDHVLPDGIGIHIGSRMQKVSLKENVNGTDMFPILCEEATKRKTKIYLLGSEPGIAHKCSEVMKQRYPGLLICGTHHGHFDESYNPEIINKINTSGAELLLVGMGAPRQDLWIADNLDKLNTKVAMGVGGLFDFYSGNKIRAPRWIREIGMEWSWRILQEPERMWKRYIVGNPLFLYRVFRYGKHQDESNDAVIKSNELDHRYNTNYVKMNIQKVTWSITKNVQHLIKRSLDIVTSTFLIIILSPLMIITCAAIKIESRGPVLFHQTRIGKDGIPFKFWKFRSMYIDAEKRKSDLVNNNEMEDSVLFKMKNDPRITHVGKIIRKTSIDELPQLWNVLVGNMSLVGPRPCLPEEAEKYKSHDRNRLESSPGITCIWQISGRSDISFKQQIEMDMEYINRSSLKQDLSILLKTIPAVISGRGAY